MLAGKCFLITITLTETRSVCCERTGVPEPMASCWITALRTVPGPHTLAEARESLGEFHFKKEKVVVGKDLPPGSLIFETRKKNY